MPEFPLNPKLLTWARQRAGLSLEQLRTKRISVEKLREWEAAEALPSLKQAEEIARRLRIPVVMLLLSEPPTDDLPIPDLRSFVGKKPRNISLSFRELLNDAIVRQDWFRENAVEERPAFTKKVFQLSDGIDAVAKHLVSSLKLNDELRGTVTSWNEFLEVLIAQSERAGVLVFRSTVVGNDGRRPLDVEEFRGFVLPDEFAPVVFLNGRDSIAAQTFTLMHELAHVSINQAGIFNGDLRVTETTAAIEAFCNAVAAEALLPREKVLRTWQSRLSREENLQRIVRFFRVSLLVATRRAFELGKLTGDEFKEAIDAEYARIARWEQARKEEKRKGGDFWSTFRTRVGSKFSDAIISAVKQRRIGYVDAGALLGIRASSVLTLARGN